MDQLPGLLTKLSFRHSFYLVRVIQVPDIRVTWLVYVRTYCVPIVTLNQSKLSRLLYLGDAQITIINNVYFLMEETPGVLRYICFISIGLK